MVDLQKISAEELASELLQRTDLFDKDGFLKGDALYKLRCKLGAVVCVDSAPVRKRDDGVIEVMAIKRKTGSYAGKLCLVGGLVKKDSSLEESIRLHFKTDLGLEIDFVTPWDKPACIHQGMRPLSNGGLKVDFIPDPTKDHVIAPVYLVKLKSEKFNFGISPYGGQEVEGVVWFSLEEMPDREEFGYQHDIVFKKCLLLAKNFLK